MIRGRKKGFTLVELIVVIAIIAIIAAVAVPTTISYVNKAKVSVAEQEVLSLMNTITESFTLIAAEKEGRVAKDTIKEVLVTHMPDTEQVTEVTISQDGDRKLKVTVKAGDLASSEQSFEYSTFKLTWGEGTETSFTFVPDDEEVWALA